MRLPMARTLCLGLVLLLVGCLSAADALSQREGSVRVRAELRATFGGRKLLQLTEDMDEAHEHTDHHADVDPMEPAIEADESSTHPEQDRHADDEDEVSHPDEAEEGEHDESSHPSAEVEDEEPHQAEPERHEEEEEPVADSAAHASPEEEELTHHEEETHLEQAPVEEEAEDAPAAAAHEQEAVLEEEPAVEEAPAAHEDEEASPSQDEVIEEPAEELPVAHTEDDENGAQLTSFAAHEGEEASSSHDEVVEEPAEELPVAHTEEETASLGEAVVEEPAEEAHPANEEEEEPAQEAVVEELPAQHAEEEEASHEADAEEQPAEALEEVAYEPVKATPSRASQLKAEEEQEQESIAQAADFAEVLREKEESAADQLRSAWDAQNAADAAEKLGYTESSSTVGSVHSHRNRNEAAKTAAPLRKTYSKTELNCNPHRNPDPHCCEVIKSVTHREALGCDAADLPTPVRAVATRAVPARAAQPARVAAVPARRESVPASVPAAEPIRFTGPRAGKSALEMFATSASGGARGRWSVNDLLRFEEKQEALQRREDERRQERAQRRAEERAAKRQEEEASPKPPPKLKPPPPVPKRSEPRDGEMLYVTWVSEPCEMFSAEIEGCQNDTTLRNSAGVKFSRHPRQNRLMMVKRWAQSVVRVDAAARVLVLTDQHTPLPDLYSGCARTERERKLFPNFDVVCTDYLEYYRAEVDVRDMNLGKLQALSELLNAEALRNWAGHTMFMDYDMLLLQDVRKTVFSHKFDLGLTWKTPTVPKSSPKWMPVDTGVLYFHQAAREASITLLDDLVGLFKAKFDNDLWWGDLLVLRETMKDTLLPPDKSAVWTATYNHFDLVFWPALYHNHDAIPLEVPEEKVFVLHFRGSQHAKFKLYWDMLKEGRPLPTADHLMLHPDRVGHSLAYLKAHGIEPPKDYNGRRDVVVEDDEAEETPRGDDEPEPPPPPARRRGGRSSRRRASRMIADDEDPAGLGQMEMVAQEAEDNPYTGGRAVAFDAFPDDPSDVARA